MSEALPREGLSPVRRILGGAIAALAGATLALLMTSLVLPARALFALHWYLVGGVSIVSVAAIRLLMARSNVLWNPDRGLMPAKQAESPDVPARLRAITALVSRAGWDAAGFDQELRPILRGIARQRLAAGGAMGLDGGAGRALLGEQGWALLALGGRTWRRGERGPTANELRDVVERLERKHGGVDD